MYLLLWLVCETSWAFSLWRSINQTSKWKSYHILKEWKESLDIQLLVSTWFFVAEISKEVAVIFKNLLILAHFCKVICVLTFSCTSFRSASLDVEPIYTFRAHRWVFDKNTVLFEKYKIFKQTRKFLKQFPPCQLVVPCSAFILILFKIPTYFHLFLSGAGYTTIFKRESYKLCSSHSTRYSIR